MARCRANAASPKPSSPSGLRRCRHAARGVPAWHAPPRRGPFAWPGEQHAPHYRCHAPQSQRSCGCRGRGSGRSRTSVPGFAPAGTSRPSTRLRRDGWQCAWSAGATSAVAGPVPGGSSGHVRAAHDGSWTRWRCRYPRRPMPGQSAPAASRRSAARWPPPRFAPVRPRSKRAMGRGAQRPADDPPVANRHRPSSAAGCGRRCPPGYRPGRAEIRPHRLVQCHPPGSGGLPGGSFALAFVEDRREFF